MTLVTDMTGKTELHQAFDGTRHLTFSAFFFSIFVNLLMLTGPLFMLQVYDRVLGSRSEETLIALLILVVGLYGLMWMLDFARARLVARFGARLQSALDARVFSAQLRLPNEDLKPEQASATRDLEAIQTFYASPVFLALMDAPFTPIFIAAIFIFHPLLGTFALVGGLVLIIVTAANQVLTSRRVAKAQNASDYANQYAENAKAASQLVRSQGMIAPVTQRWMAFRQAALIQSMNASDWTSLFSTFTKSLRLALQSLILALGAWLVLSGELTAGAMIAASILLGRSLAPVEQILGRWAIIARARQGRKNLCQFLEQAPVESVRTPLPKPEGRIEAKGVTVTTGAGKAPLLYNATFNLSPGQALGVIGRSGSGKTTIAKTLLGLIAPSVGEVRLGGALLQHYPPQDLGQFIGYLPQDPVLITGTIAENIARMVTHPDYSMVVAAAKKAKAHELILHLPDGYDTRIENNTISLSGGQRQRIALARALYGEPVVLVLDEPNSALDLEGTEALNAAVRTMKSENRSVIIMTHRPMAISECDNLMVVDAGRITAHGPRDDILKSMMRNAEDIQRSIAKDGTSG